MCCNLGLKKSVAIMAMSLGASPLISMANLQTGTSGIMMLQGASLAFVPDAVMSAYGLPKYTPMATRMAQVAGFAQLGGSLFWYLVSSGTMSTDKALAAMTACFGQFLFFRCQSAL